MEKTVFENSPSAVVMTSNFSPLRSARPALRVSTSGSSPSPGNTDTPTLQVTNSSGAPWRCRPRMAPRSRIALDAAREMARALRARQVGYALSRYLIGDDYAGTQDSLRSVLSRWANAGVSYTDRTNSIRPDLVAGAQYDGAEKFAELVGAKSGGQRQPNRQMIRVKNPAGTITSENVEVNGDQLQVQAPRAAPGASVWVCRG